VHEIGGSPERPVVQRQHVMAARVEGEGANQSAGGLGRGGNLLDHRRVGSDDYYTADIGMAREGPER
jgi:hypothetical protein